MRQPGWQNTDAEHYLLLHVIFLPPFLGTQEELVKNTKALINLEHMPAKHKILHTRISQKHKSSFVDKAFPSTLHYRIEDPDRLLDFENFYKRVALIQ